MEYYYDYEIIDGHLILLVDDMRYIIDTGAPVSVSESQTITIAGQAKTVAQDYMGYTPALLSEYIGTRINGIVGVDVLNNNDMLIYPSNSKIIISPNTLELDGEVIELTDFMGIPAISATLSNTTYKFIFDTGAKLSYMNPELINNLQRRGEVEDFYLGFGTFNTETYLATLTIGTQNIDLIVGVLPEALLNMLRLTNTSGIIGSAFLDSYKVLYAPRRNIIVIHDINI